MLSLRIVAAEVDDFFSGFVACIGIADVPFVWHGPVEADEAQGGISCGGRPGVVAPEAWGTAHTVSRMLQQRGKRDRVHPHLVVPGRASSCISFMLASRTNLYRPST